MLQSVLDAIARVSVYADDVSSDRGAADATVGALRTLSQEQLYELLSHTDIGARARDSRGAMLKRLHDRLTARVRARERNEV